MVRTLGFGGFLLVLVGCGVSDREVCEVGWALCYDGAPPEQRLLDEETFVLECSETQSEHSFESRLCMLNAESCVEYQSCGSEQ